MTFNWSVALDPQWYPLYAAIFVGAFVIGFVPAFVMAVLTFVGRR